MTKSSTPLRILAVKSAIWYGGTRLWFQVVSWGITILLARLLAPSDYGLFAMALSVLALLELLQEFGLGTAIVQRQDLTRQHINAVFWIVASISLVLTAATFLSAGAIASFYSEPRLTWALRFLCLTFFLNSLGMVPYSLLTRAIDLRRRSLAEVIGSATSALLTLGLAYRGHGVWALVFGHFGRAIVFNLALAVLARWMPSLDARLDGMRSIMTFGLRIAGTHLAGNCSFTVITFILARFLGDVGLGLYAMAQSLAEAPHRISTAIINQVSLPLFSRLQDDRVQLGTYFLKISKYLAVVALPIHIGLVLVAFDLIPVLLSEKWHAMIVPFQLVCLESTIVVLTLTSSPLLTARGRAGLLLGRSFLSLGTLSGAVLVGAPFGLIGVTTARLIAMLPLRLTLLIPSLRELGLPLSGYLSSLTAPLTATGVMAAAVLAIQHGGLGSEGHLQRLMVAVIVGGATYPLALLLLDRGIGTEVKTTVRELLSTSGRGEGTMPESAGILPTCPRERW